MPAIAQTRAGRSAVPRTARQASRSERAETSRTHDQHERSGGVDRDRERRQGQEQADHWVDSLPQESQAARIRRSRPARACRRSGQRPRSAVLPIRATASRTATITENATSAESLKTSPPPGCCGEVELCLQSPGKKIRNATMMPASDPPAIKPVDISVPGLMSASSSLNLRALSTNLRTMPPTKIGSVVDSGR